MSSYHCSSYLFFSDNTKNQFTSTQIFNNWSLKIDYKSTSNNSYTKSIKSPKPRSTWFPIK